MLDHLEDPHNFGAIIRTSEALFSNGGDDANMPTTEIDEAELIIVHIIKMPIEVN